MNIHVLIFLVLSHLFSLLSLALGHDAHGVRMLRARASRVGAPGRRARPAPWMDRRRGRTTLCKRRGIRVVVDRHYVSPRHRARVGGARCQNASQQP
ncbi:hypothetical protein [Pandoravirus japonicus]|uniref:Uncharacterized protein n=1 Tax=Pandoravirus japonicus TaxID=2823154 RepID=A0A811BNX7_9VIRU|nr:hypothetical protein [Pandoravirus japonicus]